MCTETREFTNSMDFFLSMCSNDAILQLKVFWGVFSCLFVCVGFFFLFVCLFVCVGFFCVGLFLCGFFVVIFLLLFLLLLQTSKTQRHTQTE